MNFDQKLERKHTNSIKWDGHQMFKANPEALPLWVADMDFKSDEHIIAALTKLAEFGVYGYSFEPESYFEAVKGWMRRRHNWTIEHNWIFSTPGVVSAVNACILALSNEGDGVLIQEPVYHPFKNSIKYNKRVPIINPLKLEGTHYSIDFNDFEQKIVNEQVKLFILCSPHNPVGRVWTQVELTQMLDICSKHQVIVVSDEIHMDFVYEPHKHVVAVSLNERYQAFVITLVAPSKSFNLATFKLSQLITSNEDFMSKIRHEYERLGLHGQNQFSIVASEMAYTHGDAYMDALVETLKKNIDWVNAYVATELPQIKVMDIEGTYLMWFDFRALNRTQKDLVDFLMNQAKLWLNDGSMFGEGGEGFMRVNVATDQETLKQAFDQLKAALND